MKKGVTGYGFNLHSEKSKPGQYIRAVDEDSPADKAGLKPQDKIVQVRISTVQDVFREPTTQQHVQLSAPPPNTQIFKP